MADNPNYIIDKTLDEILENLPMGSVQRAIFNNLYGINYRQLGNAVPGNRDRYGYTFFTRPQLNLSTVNITNYRGFYSLLTQNKESYQRFTRCMLDPRMGRDSTDPSLPLLSKGIVSPLVDMYSPFISVLTNNCVSVSGWPDLTAPVRTSDAGLLGQEHSMVDGATNHYEAYDIDASFRNTRGNPLIYLFYIWIKYETLVFEGILNPYLDMIVENEIDYNTRIYRLVMDAQNRYVTQICCTGASFPINVPSGNLFDYNNDTPYNTKNSEINIRFRSMGFLAFEDIIKYWFNSTVAIFNPDMRRQLHFDKYASAHSDSALREDPRVIYVSASGSYYKIPHITTSIVDIAGIDAGALSLNHKLIPYINLYTNELEWWTSSSNVPPRLVELLPLKQ